MRTQFVPVSIQFPFSFPCFPREIFIPSWSLTPEGTLWRSQVPCSCHGDLLELGLNRPEGLRPIPWEMRRVKLSRCLTEFFIDFIGSTLQSL